jgi:hypothetical protein
LEWKGQGSSISHVASVNCFVTDLQDARTAAAACGFELREGQTTHAWYGYFAGDTAPPAGRDPKDYGKCQHALRLRDHRQGDYEIGLVPRVDGQPGWELLADYWGQSGRRLEAAAGPGLGKLKNEIAAAAGLRVLQRQGYRVVRTINAEGEIQLLAQR